MQASDPVEAAERLGSTYQKPHPLVVAAHGDRQRLEGEVEIRRSSRASQCMGVEPSSKRLRHCFSEKRLRSSNDKPACRRETQSGLHLLEEEIRTEEDPSPTPSQRGQSQYATGLPDEDGPYPDLRWACVKFTGVIDEMRPPSRNKQTSSSKSGERSCRLEEFGFNSLAVEAARSCGDVLVLTLSASDATATRRGLDKSSPNRSGLGEWFQCEVRVGRKPPVQGAKNAQKPLRGRGLNRSYLFEPRPTGKAHFYIHRIESFFREFAT